MAKDDELIELTYPKYWDERYRTELTASETDTSQMLHSYEWFRSFEQIRPFLEHSLPPASSKCHILHLGCGNSSLTADLDAPLNKNQTSVDFSQVVIDAMKLKYSEINTRWEVMDVRDLRLLDCSVDLAIDKSTLDGMIHGSLWDPPPLVRSNVGKYVDEVARVLKPGGEWLYITYRQPHFMKLLLEREDLWQLAVKVLEDPNGSGGFEYFGLVMKRHQAPTIS